MADNTANTNANSTPNTAPAPIQDFGANPSVTPSYVDPTQNQAYMQEYERLYAQMLGPQFAQQQQQLQDSNASRGISSSGAASYLEGNLMGQEASALAGGLTPIVQQGYGYAQQDIMANQNYANSATDINAAYYDQARNANFGAYNNYQNELTGAMLGTYGPNAGVGNMFSNSLSGANSAYLNAWDLMQQQQQQELQYAGMALAGGG